MNAVQSSLSAQLALGDRALNAVTEAMPMIRFDPTQKAHLYAVTLHASIVQLCGGCLALAKTEFTAGIPVLLRSMFEAIIDLDNLVQDANYHERMTAANIEQFLKVLRDSPQNPLLEGLGKKYDVATISATLQAQLDELRRKKRAGLSIQQRCTDVGREHQYTGHYRLLCLDAHNNVASLIDRHVTESDSESLEVALFGDGNPLGLPIRVHWAVGWMLQSAQYVHGAFRTGYDVSGLLREHEALRQT